jgi:hypothetical protein
MTITIVSKMTNAEAFSWRNRLCGTANQLRALLLEGYERQAWTALGYSDWTECIKALAEEYEFSERHMWRLHAANVTQGLLTPGSVEIIPEKQLRPLTKLEPDEQQEVWQRAVDTAPDGNITARHVQQVVAEHIEEKNGGNGDDPIVDEKTGEILFSGNGNGRHLPQTNRAGNEEDPRDFDDCQTPPYALDPLIPYLDYYRTIWEPARGDGQLVEAFFDSGYTEYQIISSSIQDGQNFFSYEPPGWECLVTNPPYSVKYPWLKRCYELGKPFALLLPVATLGARQAQELFRAFGVQIIFMDQRVDFKMPNKGYQGNAQFAVAWFTWQLSLETDMVFTSIEKAKKAFVDAF